MRLIDPVRPLSAMLHQQVRMVRELASQMHMPIDDLTDLDVIAMAEWATHWTPPTMTPQDKLRGLVAAMHEDETHS